MSMDRRQRLARLEGESHPPQLLSERRWPSDHDERSALSQGLDAWRACLRDHRWSDAEIDDELEWDAVVDERCDESGLEDFEIMADMIAFTESGGEWHDYPGPGYWGEGVPNGQMYLH